MVTVLPDHPGGGSTAGTTGTPCRSADRGHALLWASVAQILMRRPLIQNHCGPPTDTSESTRNEVDERSVVAGSAGSSGPRWRRRAQWLRGGRPRARAVRGGWWRARAVLWWLLRARAVRGGWLRAPSGPWWPAAGSSGPWWSCLRARAVRGGPPSCSAVRGGRPAGSSGGGGWLLGSSGPWWPAGSSGPAAGPSGPWVACRRA